MSYDISLVNPVTKEPIEIRDMHFMTGGTYQVGGCHELWLNVTYNYADQFVKVFGDNGIHVIEGKSAIDTIPILNDAINKLKDDAVENYWESTEGNAKIALKQLLAMAKMRPDAEWKIC